MLGHPLHALSRAAVIVALAAACHSSSEPAPSPPSGPAPPVVAPAPSAATLASAKPRAWSVVARVGNGHVSIHRLGRDKLVLDAGVFVYVVGAEGPPRLLGSVADYGIDVPSDDTVGTAADAPSFALRPRVTTNGEVVTIAAPREHRRVWDGTRWNATPVPEDGGFPPIQAVPELEATSGPVRWKVTDDALYRIEGGARERVTLPDTPAPTTKLRLVGTYPEVKHGSWVRGADGGFQMWQDTYVDDLPKPSARTVGSVVTLEEGTAFVLEWLGWDLVLLHRWSAGASPGAPLEIGTPFDQSAEVRLTRPIRAWSGACPQAFVELDAKANAKVVTTTLVAAKQARVHAVALRGRLADRTTEGVVLMRSDHEAPATALPPLVKRLAAVPGARALCDVPVPIERIPW